MKLFQLIIFLTVLVKLTSCDKEDSSDLKNPDQAVDFSISRDTVNVGDTLVIKWTGIGVWEYDQTIFTTPIIDQLPNTSFLIAAKSGSYSINYNGINSVTKKIAIRGGNWNLISEIEHEGKLATTETSLFIQNWSYIVRSNDMGHTWQLIGNELPVNSFGRHEIRCFNILNNVIYISIRQKNEVYSHIDETVSYKSIDNGNTWINANFNNKEPQYILNNKMYFTDFYPHPSPYGCSSVYVYSPDNNSWLMIGDYFSSKSIIGLTSINSNLYAICGYSDSDINITELWKFDGTSWSAIDYKGIEGYPNYIFSNNLSQLFMITTKGFYKSVDMGVNWIKIHLEGEPTNYNIFNILETGQGLKSIVNVNNNTLIANINYTYNCDILNSSYPLLGGGGFISIDNGLTWKSMGILADNMIINNNIIYATYGSILSCPLSEFQ